MPHSPDFDLYLASASPRRRELLQQIAVSFHVIDGLQVDESLADSELPGHFVERVAAEKAQAGERYVREQGLPLLPVLGADTCIEIDNEILGKPANREHGIAMLQRLSGHTHNVLTGICLLVPAEHGNRMLTDISSSRVTFKELSPGEIESYWETGEPMDKAGAYAIQGLAASFITELHGSYSGVVGLPLFEFTRLLAQAG